jgi:hypothetical protein
VPRRQTSQRRSSRRQIWNNIPRSAFNTGWERRPPAICAPHAVVAIKPERAMKITVALSVLLLTASVAAAQEYRQGDASKDLTNCKPSSVQNQTTGAASSDAQAVEKSAILPSAGGHENSAAPTVQRDGESVEVRPDCPQDASQPKAKD